jgi:hypothetical protein
MPIDPLQVKVRLADTEACARVDLGRLRANVRALMGEGMYTQAECERAEAEVRSLAAETGRTELAILCELLEEPEEPREVPPSCEGVKCGCGRQAAHKVEEVFLRGAVHADRHPLAAYVCQRCFVALMGAAGVAAAEEFDTLFCGEVVPPCE